MKESPLVTIGAVCAILAWLFGFVVLGFAVATKQSVDRIEAMVENINGHPLYQPEEPPKKPPYRPYHRPGSTGAIGSDEAEGE